MAEQQSHDHSGHQHKGHDHHHHSHGGLHHHHGLNKGLKVAFFLNLCFAVIELVGGLYVNSVAILSDALHDFGDTMAIGAAWFLERKSHSNQDEQYSYGYRRWSTLSAILTSSILVAGSVAIFINSIQRLQSPSEPNGAGMILLALLGIVVNGFAFVKMEGGSLNQKAIRWHLIEDVLGWVIILIGAVVIELTGFSVLDPIMAIFLAVWVCWNVVKVLKSSFLVFLQAVPEQISIAKIEKALSVWSEIGSIHHTHLWTLDGEIHILTTHLVLKKDLTPEEVGQLKSRIKAFLKENYQIKEATIEIEYPEELCHDPKHSSC